MKIIIWSGGADSTLCLYDALIENPQDTLALSLDHPMLDAKQRVAQNRAMTNFKRWVRRRHGAIVKHHTVTVRFPATLGAAEYIGQHGLFLATLFPYMGGKSNETRRVVFGYIRGDDFWHYRTNFEDSFKKLCDLAYLNKMQLDFPLEWEGKAAVLNRLRAASIPDDAWWTCDRPIDSKTACGTCLKCEAVSHALQKGAAKNRTRRQLQAKRRVARKTRNRAVSG